MGISIGLVGLGRFGSEFADMYMKHPLVSRVGLCDREPERIAKFAERDYWKAKFNPADTFETLDDICKADFDALVLITQPWLHAAQAIQAMESGKHVYSAVPVVSLPDGDEILDWCDKLVKTAEKTGQHYMLGETSYYRPQAMYCRRKAAEGAFGRYVLAEGRYFHDVEHGLRQVQKDRANSKAGQEWVKLSKQYSARGVYGGPMHYPTHSIAGPICVMNAHAVKVSAWGLPVAPGDDFFGKSPFSNETALFRMSNDATMRICEYREVGYPEFEGFTLYGTGGSFVASPMEKNCSWVDLKTVTPVTIDEMRDPLPEEVADAWRDEKGEVDLGGHGGSHAYMVNEFVQAVAANRVPTVNAWEAVRYMAAGVMAHKSCLKDGELLDVPDWGDAPK